MLRKFLLSYREVLREDGWIILLLLILNLPPIIMAFCYTGEKLFTGLLTEGIRTFYFGTIEILIICATLHFALKDFPCAKFSLQMLILFGFAVSFVIDIFLIQTFRITLHPHFIEIAFATNPNEAKEFLQMYVLKPKIICAVGAFGFLIVAAVKMLRKTFQSLSENNLRRISYYTLIIFLPVVAVLILGSGNFILSSALSGTILGRNLSNTYTTMKIFGSESEIIAEMKTPREKILSNNSKIPAVVFVLGEAETRNHMQIYGYNLETTPLAFARYQRGELFKFNDVIACANDTSAAMKLIFTFAEKDSDAENWYKAANIFDIASRAGYRTAYISNQSPVGWRGNLDKIYAECCDEQYFTEAKIQNGKNFFSRDFDEILFPALDKFISQAHEKNFYFVHLYGSHPIYGERYPQSFAKFTAESEDFAQKTIAEYDNSILYTDFILDEIFKRFEDKNALIIYISDHGQEIFEDGDDFAGHSVEEAGSRGMIEIPMFIWTSKSFREMYPEKIAALKNSADNPYRTDFLIHTILDLLEIQTENFETKKSIINANFDTSFQRFYNGKLYTKNF